MAIVDLFSKRTAQATYYHGTSTAVVPLDEFRLLPPDETGNLSEAGRIKNLDMVFFTEDYNYANIYAQRAVNQFGGDPVIFRVIPMGDVRTINDKPGATVYSTIGAFMELT